MTDNATVKNLISKTLSLQNFLSKARKHTHTHTTWDVMKKLLHLIFS